MRTCVSTSHSPSSAGAGRFRRRAEAMSLGEEEMEDTPMKCLGTFRKLIPSQEYRLAICSI
ncbi:hypothetical protein M404DRAFT_999046 [Pisolithus tinctorius Marx 270]|uniref:Uncharacterized protein n=1 Tax=Pisolithus tinctorius Marx 270 TaxID=870435 RepID=A0A0C3JBE4_PISTI|nr:hypothetical protein M404DRAFT_999046 [Pisolithus tinctorius Marx 270]